MLPYRGIGCISERNQEGKMSAMSNKNVFIYFSFIFLK